LRGYQNSKAKPSVITRREKQTRGKEELETLRRKLTRADVQKREQIKGDLWPNEIGRDIENGRKAVGK
jgi:hypothetical protein